MVFLVDFGFLRAKINLVSVSASKIALLEPKGLLGVKIRSSV
jgi:hypothetical protein